MKIDENRQDHERFEELTAIAMAGSLSEGELAELEEHCKSCVACRQERERYGLLIREGMPWLAERYAGQSANRTTHSAQVPNVDAASIVERILSRSSRTDDTLEIYEQIRPMSNTPLISGASRWWTNPGFMRAAAACLLLMLGYVGYRVVLKTRLATEAQIQAQSRANALASQKQVLTSQLSSQSSRIAQLEAQSSEASRKIEELRAQLQAGVEQEQQREAEAASNLKAASAEKSQLEGRLLSSDHAREELVAHLNDLQKAYQSAQTELVNLRTEHDRTTLQLTALETENRALVAANRDQQRRLDDQEQFLSSDRDIRELMGARQLYMADVFDVSSDSRTRKPYGRIFYTKGKSLIFYAFDLDHQPGVKAAAYQAWGRNESSKETPINLGILYQDNVQNRRWVLRFDDPRRLAEIDAVFVTVEPRGGSEKPTGKPFLYASLRREPNHP